MSHVYAKCPICAEPLPVFAVSAIQRGVLRPRIELVITEDATDFIAHMWAHEEEGTWASTRTP